MTCNDVLIRLRYMFDYSDAEMITVFAEAEHITTEDQIKKWLAGEESPCTNPLVIGSWPYFSTD